MGLRVSTEERLAAELAEALRTDEFSRIAGRMDAETRADVERGFAALRADLVRRDMSLTGARPLGAYVTRGQPSHVKGLFDLGTQVVGIELWVRGTGPDARIVRLGEALEVTPRAKPPASVDAG